MFGILVAILILGVAVFIHELGHFLVMRRNGIKVLEFAIGFGPRLLARQSEDNQTVYALRAIPLGGFVRPVDEGPESMSEARPWVQFKVAAAGPMMNCVLGFIAGLVLLYAQIDSPILQHELLAWAPEFLRPIVLALVASFGVAIITPAYVFYLAATNFLTLMSGLAGPIGILHMGSQIGGDEPTTTSVAMGSLFFLYLINVGIAGANLMPLHPFDGGHCVKAVMAKIPYLNRPKALKVFNYVTAVLVILLIAMVCTADVLRLAGVNLAG